MTASPNAYAERFDLPVRTGAEVHRVRWSARRWTDVALVLVAYVLLVWSVELTSSLLRPLAR